MDAAPLAPPDRLVIMLASFGTHPGQTCGECRHLSTVKHSGQVCRIARKTHRRFWSRDWPACGRFKGTNVAAEDRHADRHSN